MVRKKDVSTLYRTRQGLTKEESEKYFCHPQILNFAEDKYSDVGYIDLTPVLLSS